ncbi:hypothetical protein AK88_03308 [Plasmodium fragile]|uniref:Uncharacterized protein n=1 Tax=Plasmodium fragile TaxID=5857 RepID=A0A0D9QMR8_PLAFR|nr:uncharacterized protein AK88_03308 [Plasmodium fragile]KJP87026.1 hypothetical protein AK88_03308 [Plasmodium fragile]
MNYSFLGQNNRKAIFTIIKNYINLSQYELARSLLHHLVVTCLFTRDDFTRDDVRRRRTRTDMSTEEKLYYLKKTLKFMRRFLPYGCSPLQIFSNEQSSAHFLLKVARDYNRFVDLIFGNLLTTCGVRKAHLGGEPWRSVTRLPRHLRSLLRKKYVPKQLQNKIAFDVLLATIMVHREYYLCAFEDPSFFPFSLDTVQCLRRIYYMYVKGRELLLGRGKRGRKKDLPGDHPHKSSTRWKAKVKKGQWRLLNLFNRIVPFNVPTRGTLHKKNTPHMGGNSPNRRAKRSCGSKIRKTDQLHEVDELVLHCCRVVYGEKADRVRGSTHVVSSNHEENEEDKKDKGEGTPSSMHIIYIPPLHIINKRPIYNYINTFEEETHYFCQHNVVTSLYRELFCLVFFFPALGVELLKTLCLNQSFFDFLLTLLHLLHSEGSHSAVGNYVKDGSDGTAELGAAREGGVSVQMRVGPTNGKNPVKADAPLETGMEAETETEAETPPIPVRKKKEKKKKKFIKNCYFIFTQLYYSVVEIYIHVLVEKLKKKDLVNYFNFLYLIKFNHIFMNNAFFFSMCFANVRHLTDGELNGEEKHRREFPLDSSHHTNVKDDRGDTHLRSTPQRNLHLAQKALHKVYDWLVLLVFHFNGDEGAVHHFGHCPEYPPDRHKKENEKKDEKEEKKTKENKEDVTFYKVLLRGIVLHIPINYSHIRAIFFFYVNKMKEKREERTSPKTNHKKSVMYDILMSTNTFRCSDQGLVVNVLLHLFNYADDLYCRWVQTCALYYHVRSRGKEDLLFCLNGSRIRGVHFLGYLFDLCQVHMANQEFLLLNRLLQNFKELKNLCILFCLENATDVHVKLKCLSEMKASRNNVYLYNYIKDMKVRVKISSHHYHLYKQNRRVKHGCDERRLTENEIFLALKESSSAALLNQLHLLHCVGYTFLAKMAQMARCKIKNDLYRREVRMNTNFLLFYASMRSVFLCLQGRGNVEQIKTYYKLITYRECRVKALLYITVLVFQGIRMRQEGVKPHLFMWIIHFLSRKLRYIKQDKSLFLYNLKCLLIQIVCDVYVRLFVFIQKCRSIHVDSKNGKNGFRRVLRDSHKFCIRGREDAKLEALYQMRQNSNDRGSQKEVLLQMGGRSHSAGVESKLGLVQQPVSVTPQGKKLRHGIAPMLPYTRVTTERVLVSHLIGKVKRISSMGGVHIKRTSKGSAARRKGSSVFNYVIMVERYLRREERSSTKRTLPLGGLHVNNERFNMGDLKKADLKRADLNNISFGRHFLELMCSDPQEYLYRNVADGRNNHLNMFIFFIYKKQVSTKSLRNLLHYLELNTLFKSLYMGQPTLSCKWRGETTLQNKSLTPFFEMMLFYYEQYRWNEVNRYLLPNSCGVDLFSLYNFLDMCVSCSNTVESGVALLRFVRKRIRRGGVPSPPARLAHFLLCFVNRLHVLISIKSRPSLGDRKRENPNRTKKERTETNPSRKTPRIVKPVLLNKYLLLKCNSLKVQSKLIEKYFVDLYKRKHFLKDMFLRFNNLKRKKKKYINVKYEEMIKCLNKYCHLLLQNDEGVTINYLFFFFLYAKILIKNMHSSMTDRPSQRSFYQFASNSKEKFSNPEIIYEQGMNYNLFFILTVDVDRLIKFCLFLCNSFSNARRMCSLFFIHYHRVLVQNIGTQCCVKNCFPLFPSDWRKDSAETIFTTSFLRTKKPNKDVTPRKSSLGYNYIRGKCSEQPEEKHLTGEFFFFLSDVVGALEQVKRRITPREGKRRKKKTCKLKLLLLKYLQHVIDTQEGVTPDGQMKSRAGGGNPAGIPPEQRFCNSKKQCNEDNPSVEDKDELMNLFICLEKCDQYFPFIFNTLYGYAFSEKYNFLNRLIVERYNSIKKILWICHRERGVSADDGVLQAVSEDVSWSHVSGVNHVCGVTGFSVYCLKYEDLEHLNGFTRCLLNAAMFDGQHNMDCLHLYELVKAPKGETNVDLNTKKKLNKFYEPLLRKMQSASSEEVFNNPFKLKRKMFSSAPRNFLKKEEPFTYLLRETTPLESLLDVVVNLFMKDDHTLSRMTLQEVILVLNTSYCRCEEFLSEDQAVWVDTLRCCDEVDCYTLGRLPNTLRGNAIKVGVYMKVLRMVKKVQRVLNEEAGLHEEDPSNAVHRSTKQRAHWVKILKAIVNEPMGEQDTIKFITQHRLFKHAPFLLNYKLGSITSDSKRKQTLQTLETKCKAAYILHLWRSHNPRKKKKIISFLKNLKEEKEVQILLSRILYHRNNNQDMQNFFSFIHFHFKANFVKRFYLLSLVSHSLQVQPISRMKIRQLFFSLLWRDKLDLIRFILRNDLYRPRLYTLFRYAFLCIHIDLSTCVSSKRALWKEHTGGRTHCRGENYEQKNAPPYSLFKCLCVLQIAALVRGEDNEQLAYATFLRVTQVLFDRVCRCVGDTMCKGLCNDLPGETPLRGCVKLKKARQVNRQMNRPAIANGNKEPPPHGKLKKKFSLFGQFFHKHLNANGVKTKGKSGNNAYIRHYDIVKLEEAPQPRCYQNNVRKTQMSINILLYTFYKVCLFFYEHYKEMRRQSNLLCTLLPMLIYVQTSLQFRVHLKSVMKLDITDLIDLLKVKNFNLCNQLIHRIYSSYIYNVNPFGVLGEPTLFFPLASSKRRFNKYKMVKNIVSLLRCREGPMIRDVLPLRKVSNFYVYKYAHETCVYRQYVDMAGVVARELGADRERVLYERDVVKCSSVNAVNREDLSRKVQRLHFSVLAFYVALLSKCNMDLYLSLNLFFSFTCTYHCSSNVYKKYKNLISHFSNVHVHQGGTVLASMNNDMGISERTAHKLLSRNGGRSSGKSNTARIRHPRVMYKMVLQVSSERGVHPWKGCTYLGHIWLELKKERNSLAKGVGPSVTYHLVRSDDVALFHQIFVPNRSGNRISCSRLNRIDLLLQATSTLSPQSIYSPTASIYVRRHLLTSVAFSYLYSYQHDIYFGGDCRDIPSVRVLTQKQLLMYAIENINNPYVVIRKGMHPVEECPVRRGACPGTEGEGTKMRANDGGDKKGSRLPNAKTSMMRKAHQSRVEQLKKKQKTFTFKNYLRQKRVERNIILFRQKLKMFQQYIKRIYNESLQRHVFEFFSSSQLTNHYERFFNDMDAPCSFPLCYAYPSSNLALCAQYFKKSFHEVCADMALSKCDGRVDGGTCAGKTRNFLFVTSLLLPYGARCPRLPSYNCAKCDRGRLAALRSYFSPDTLLSVCTKSDLTKDCFRIIHKKGASSAQFSRLIKRACRHNYIYKMFQHVSRLEDPRFQRELKCHLMKRRMYALLYNYLVFSGDYLNAVILCVHNFSVAQNTDTQNGYLNSALVNLTLITNTFDSKVESTCTRKMAHEPLIIYNHSRLRKRSSKFYRPSNFNILLGQMQKGQRHQVTMDTIHRCMDLITLQHTLLNAQLGYPVKIMNCKRVEILLCIQILVYKKKYNLADNVINVYHWKYTFTYCLACLFCVLLKKNFCFLEDVLHYVKIKLNSEDMNMFLLHVLHLFLEYRTKWRHVYEHVKRAYGGHRPDDVHGDLHDDHPTDDTSNRRDLLHDVLLHITDHDCLFYAHTLLFIYDKQQYAGILKNMKRLLFSNICKNEIYKTIIGAYKFAHQDRRMNFNLIHAHRKSFKKVSRRRMSLTHLGSIEEDYNFAQLMSLGKKYPDNIKQNILREILAIRGGAV